METFSQRLNKLRSRHGISQNELSKRLGVTRATVNSWEMGTSYPSAQSLVELASFFKTSTDYLLGIEDREAVDISGLTAEEKKIVAGLMDYFSRR